MVFLTNVSGVKNKNGKRIPKLKTRYVYALIKSGVITGGMIPKIQSALKALKAGVGEVTITNGAKGINFKYGTRIVR